MKKNVLSALVSLLLLSSCAGEFNKVYKSSNIDYRYEYAKECFAMGKYVRAATLLQELVTIEKGTDNGEECLYMLAMSEYMARTMRQQQSISRNISRHTHADSTPRWLLSTLEKVFT
jgi:outer membrane protein assembly factor BamD